MDRALTCKVVLGTSDSEPVPALAWPREDFLGMIVSGFMTSKGPPKPFFWEGVMRARERERERESPEEGRGTFVPSSLHSRCHSSSFSVRFSFI